MSIITKKLSFLEQHGGMRALARIGRGIEREALRVTIEGQLSLKPHPEALGRPLTHSWITTDFSEALLELITPVAHDLDTTLHQLTDLHVFTMQHMGTERLWPSSMPCFVRSQNEVPIAQYGTSFTGKAKMLYREGLKVRYGALMQVISGIHYNFSVHEDVWQLLYQFDQSQISMSDFKSEGYFRLIRNFQKIAWVVPYLFGASPALCHTFLEEKKIPDTFEKLGKGSFYMPYATSLRMSDLGYTTDEQEHLQINYNSLEEYLSSLRKALKTPSQRFAKLGIFDAEGQRQQMNDRVLQIENEYYAPIRPKRVTQGDEKPAQALERGGVEYIEVRLLDVNPYSMIGIERFQIQILDLMLLSCLLDDASKNAPEDAKLDTENLNKVVKEGRKPGLTLHHQGKQVLLQDWLGQLFSQWTELARCLDATSDDKGFEAALQDWQSTIEEPEHTLSGRMMAQLKQSNIDHVHWAKALMLEHETLLKSNDYMHWDVSILQQEAHDSLKRQELLEQKEQGNFEAYLNSYYSEHVLGE